MPTRSPRKKTSSSGDHIDLRSPIPTFQEYHAQGKALRDTVPREVHAEWKPDAKREDYGDQTVADHARLAEAIKKGAMM
jgi:hypothetical protein